MRSDNAFGELVRRARDLRGLKGFELAQRIRRHPSYVSDLETGKRTETPSPDVLAALERELGVTQADLLRAWGYDLPAVASARPEPKFADLVEVLEWTTPEQVRALAEALRVLLAPAVRSDEDGRTG